MRAALFLSVAAMVMAAAHVAQAQSINDGTWAVTLITQSGDCDPSVSSKIQVRDGQINENGLFARINGGIDDAGRVALQVVRGADNIAARGTVKGVQARGSWSSPSRNCSGSWMAMRS